jgi:hypothetical protein
MTKKEKTKIDAQQCAYTIETKTEVIVRDARDTWGAAQDHATREADRLENPVTLIARLIDEAEDAILGPNSEQRFTVVPLSWKVIDAK